MDKLRERRNWTGRRDSRLVKNLLIKRRHDYAPKRVQTLIQLRQTTTRKRSPTYPTKCDKRTPAVPDDPKFPSPLRCR